MAAQFVLGTVQLGLPYGVANRTGQPSEAEAVALLAEAGQAGVRWFDTARVYGEAEQRVAVALRMPECRNCAVITKLSPLDGIGADDEFGAVAAARASIAASRAALAIDRIPVLLVHRARHITAWGGAVWRFLLAERAEGRIGRLGVSLQTIDEALAVADDHDVQHVQLPVNLLDGRWEAAAVRFASRPDLTVHARSVYLQGLLVCGDSDLWPAVPGVDAAAIQHRCADLTRVFGRDGLDDLCVAYVRGLPWVHGVVLGVETPAQLRRNLSLADREPLSVAECAQVRALFAGLPDVLLNPALWPPRTEA